MINGTAMLVLLFIALVALGIAVDARRNRRDREKGKHPAPPQPPAQPAVDSSREAAAENRGVGDRLIGWWRRRSWLGKSGIILGAIVTVLIILIIADTWWLWERPAAEPVVAPLAQEAEQQALDRTAQEIEALDDCQHFDKFPVCDTGVLPNHPTTIETMWSRGQTLYVQVRLVPWYEAGADRRERAADTIFTAWGRRLLEAGASPARLDNPEGPQRVIVLDKQRTPIVCANWGKDRSTHEVLPGFVVYGCP